MSASQTVLVTGGAGYIGSLVTRDLLSRGYQVVAADALLFGGESLLDLLSHPAFTFSKTDITDSASVEKLFARQRFDAVVHLASIVGDPACKAQPELAERTIWDGSRDLFELCERHGVRTLHLRLDVQQLRQDGGPGDAWTRRHRCARSACTRSSR